MYIARVNNRHISTQKTKNDKEVTLQDITIDDEGDGYAADKINRYFINIANHNKKWTPYTYLGPTVANPCYLYTTDEAGVQTAICSLKNTSSVGVDGIPVKLLKKTAYLITKPLSYMIN